MTTERAVTERRLISQERLIGRRTTAVSLGRAKDIDPKQSVLGHSFGYVTLPIFRSGSDEQLTMSLIADWVAIRRVIDERLARK